MREADPSRSLGRAGPTKRNLWGSHKPLREKKVKGKLCTLGQWPGNWPQLPLGTVLHTLRLPQACQQLGPEGHGRPVPTPRRAPGSEPLSPHSRVRVPGQGFQPSPDPRNLCLKTKGNRGFPGWPEAEPENHTGGKPRVPNSTRPPLLPDRLSGTGGTGGEGELAQAQPGFQESHCRGPPAQGREPLLSVPGVGGWQNRAGHLWTGRKDSVSH